MNIIEKVEYGSKQCMVYFFYAFLFELIVNQTIFMAIPILASVVVFLVFGKINMTMDD